MSVQGGMVKHLVMQIKSVRVTLGFMCMQRKAHSGQVGDANRSNEDARAKSHGFDIISASAKGSHWHAITTTQDINQQYKNKITTGI